MISESLKNLLRVLLPLVFSISVAAEPPDVVWYREYNTPYMENPNCVVSTSDGGFLMGGFVNIRNEESESIDVYPFLRKTHPNGREEWFKVIRSNGECVVEDILITTDGRGYILVGSTIFSSERGLIRFVDTQGETIMVRFLNDEISLYRIIERTEGGFAAVGQKKSGTVLGFQGALVLLNEELAIDTIQLFSNIVPGRVEFQDIQPTEYGYLLIGHAGEYIGSEKEGYLVGVDFEGNELFTKVYSKPDTFMTLFESCPASDGGFLIAGRVIGLGSPVNQTLIMKVSQEGDSLWYKIFDFAGFGYPEPSITPTISGGYILSTSEFFGFYQVAHCTKLSSSADSLWSVTVSPTPGTDDWYDGVSACTTLDGGYISLGIAEHYPTSEPLELNSILIRILPDSLDAAAAASLYPLVVRLEQNYPNPFNSSTTIPYFVNRASDVSLNLYDVLGRQAATLLDGIKPAGQHEVMFDAAGLASGIYFARMTAGSRMMTKKMVLLR